MLSAAWNAKGRTQKDLIALCQIKKQYRKDCIGLSNEELAWLTKLAKRGGWRPAQEPAHA
jgi:hypothetical protein